MLLICLGVASCLAVERDGKRRPKLTPVLILSEQSLAYYGVPLLTSPPSLPLLPPTPVP